MIGTQLDLFGGLPKPPKKITIDDEPETAKPLLKEKKLKSEERSPIDPEPVLEHISGPEVHVQLPVQQDTPEVPVWIDSLTITIDEPFDEENPSQVEDSDSALPDGFSGLPSENETETAHIASNEQVVLDSLTAPLHVLETISDRSDTNELLNMASWTVADAQNDSDFSLDNPVVEDLEQTKVTANAVEEAISTKSEVEDNRINSLESVVVLATEYEALAASEWINKEGSTDTTEHTEFNGEEITDNQAIGEFEDTKEYALDAVSSLEDKGEELKIPDDAQLYSRQYYTMRETAAMFRVNQSLIRFWENEFDILKPKKNRKGDRYFRPDDIKNLSLIYHLLKVKKFTISGAREHLKTNAKMLNNFEMVQRLEKLKSFLVELKSNLKS